MKEKTITEKSNIIIIVIEIKRIIATIMKTEEPSNVNLNTKIEVIEEIKDIIYLKIKIKHTITNKIIILDKANINNVTKITSINISIMKFNIEH